MKDWLTLGSIDLRIFVMDVEDFLLEFLPRDYGRIECSFDEVPKRSIGIVMPSYGRPEYVKQCLDSLEKSDLADCVLSMRLSRHRRMTLMTIIALIISIPVVSILRE